jgi:hypothetical protein
MRPPTVDIAAVFADSKGEQLVEVSDKWPYSLVRCVRHGETVRLRDMDVVRRRVPRRISDDKQRRPRMALLGHLRGPKDRQDRDQRP